jgi:chemotaxis protein histidine kinase CheA
LELGLNLNRLRVEVRSEGRHEKEATTSTLDLMERVLRTTLRQCEQAYKAPCGALLSRIAQAGQKASTQLGKAVEITIRGQDIRIKKSFMDALRDPMVHIIRNAVDHGIEPSGDRVARSKPSAGQLTIEAVDRFGEVRLEISDDGRGLSRDKILEKALAKNLISRFEAKDLPDEGVWNFIFHQGFSTAEKVTSVSGRGVGMDVVRQCLQDLGASIKIESREGKGSRFIIHLPAESRALDTVLVQDAGWNYAIPVESVLAMERVADARFEGSGSARLACRGRFVSQPLEIASWIEPGLGKASALRANESNHRKESDRRWLIWLGTEGRPIPVLGDELVHARLSLVRRKVQRFEVGSEGSILGYAILPSGEVASVLNPDWPLGLAS